MKECRAAVVQIEMRVDVDFAVAIRILAGSAMPSETSKDCADPYRTSSDKGRYQGQIRVSLMSAVW